MAWNALQARSSRSGAPDDAIPLAIRAQVTSNKYLDIIAVDNGIAFRNSSLLLDPWVIEDGWSDGFTRLRDRIALRFPYTRLMLFSLIRLRGRKPMHDDAEYFLNCIKVRRRGVEGRPLLFIAYDTGTRLLGSALAQDDQKPPREQALHDVSFGVTFLGAPKQGTPPPSKILAARRLSMPVVMGQSDDHQFQILRATRDFLFAEEPSWCPLPSESLRRSVSLARC